MAGKFTHKYSDTFILKGQQIFFAVYFLSPNVPTKYITLVTSSVIALFFFSYAIFLKAFKESILTRAYIRFMVFLFFLLFFSIVLQQIEEIFEINRYFLLSILFGLTVPIFILFLSEFLWGFLKSTRYYFSKENPGKWDKIHFFALSFTGLLTAFVLPDFLFGFLYFLVLSPNSNGFNPFTFYYLSFVIHYALPLDGKAEVYTYIKDINDLDFGRIVQITHINIVKLIDLLFIASLINYLATYFKPKKED
ncbi:hypothetical protein ABET51_06650 [Metabacillus fastidiosus]|uniref:hypothetical protein n=1 Tax=Metabacillus fastidiosus TaxID=1458 RepID=UPI003D2CA4B6